MGRMIRPRKLMVFDLETVPDTELARQLWDDEVAGMDDLAVTQKIWDVMREANGGRSDFPRLPFHKVVAIGCLVADIEDMPGGGESYHLKRLKCVGDEGDDEATLVRKWFDYAARAAEAAAPFRLVGFNTRGFDLPVMKLRGLAHGVSAPWLFQAEDKWSNYNSRYDSRWHIDLLDTLQDYGAARTGLKLNEVCVMIGLPGKLDIDGSKVGELYQAGEIGMIRDYCETDVLNTYLLYLRFQRLAGYLSDEALAREEASLREMLAEEGGGRPHLQAFLDAWPEQAPVDNGEAELAA